ncbi:hypothetical protein [Rhodococcus sp. SORGH_AS_0301]|uniref:hypothetical protein n=1 Tax=Rhodococcus sp. SORGH_AS_0301 TaxID=3041780 RepID=UPI002787C6FA|nr:hypothetical protein [Rhodococcus sp. SORGH_AS_0301]MDQ1179198.1 hypothetical protein [Rhodococcus sp. SORGH_AS_0301]
MTDVDPRTELTRDQQVGHYIDLWKKTVDVQQHFNDIEWRIRGLALTVATFSIGAAGVAAKDGAKVGPLSLGTILVLVGLVLWYTFYFVDRAWYHPLLKAAVVQGTNIEDEIKKELPHAGMTAAITAGSKYRPGRIVGALSGRESMQSEDKLVWFYKVGAIALIFAATGLQLNVLFEDSRSEPIAVLDSVPPTSNATTSSNPPPTNNFAPQVTPGGTPPPSVPPKTALPEP